MRFALRFLPCAFGHALPSLRLVPRARLPLTPLFDAAAPGPPFDAAAKPAYMILFISYLTPLQR
jgi:hypothetical protein